MSKRAIIFTIIIIFFLLTLVGIIKGIRAHEKQALAMMPTVEVAKAQKAMWREQIYATGNISAINGVMVRSEVSGRITKIYFVSGDYVEKGQPLFQIYPDILEAQLKNNESALSLAQVDYQRSVDLYQKRVISQQSLDQQTNELRQAQAMVDQTKAQLAQNNIVAPVSGRLGLKYIDVGDYVNAGDKLVNLQQIDPLRIEFSVPDRFINTVKIGDEVAIEPSSTPGEVYMGNVYALDSAVDVASQSFSMWAEIPNPYHQLLPGAYVYVTLSSGKPKQVIMVPQTSVVYSPEGTYVFVVENNKAKQVAVTPGERFGDNIQVIKGLKEGDVVVTAGQVKIFDGAPVKISPNVTYAATADSKQEVITFATKPKPVNQNEAAAPRADNPEASMVSPVPGAQPSVSSTNVQSPTNEMGAVPGSDSASSMSNNTSNNSAGQ